ncbi:MAG: hypothetical protein JWQ35_252 [Bacteriovoracaceae bacterium]|nr:hypothetical protein [Bacteriovoracaceae bacterium]
METNKIRSYETSSEHLHSLICWRSIIAGLFITFISYLILSSLGAGIFGLALSSAISRENGGTALATGGGVWLGITIAVSLFLGGYFTVKLSHSAEKKIGSIQGTLVASVFFVLSLLTAGTVLSSVAKGAGSFTAAIGGKAADMSTNPIIQNSLQNILSGTTFKSDPKEVIQGLSTRLMSGDMDSAKNYLAAQTNLTPDEIDAKLDQARQAIKRAGESAAKAGSAAGWALFVLLSIGLIAAAFGGYESAQHNAKYPRSI